MKRSEKLSIVFLFDDTLDSTAGVAQYVKTMGAWLSRQGHTVNYLVGETKLNSWAGGTIHSLSKNLKVRFNGNRLSTPRPTTNSRKIKQLLKEIKPDVMYVQVPYSPYMSQKVIKRAGTETAVIGSFNILPSSWQASWGVRSLKLLLAPSLRRIDKMLAVSPAAAKFEKRQLGMDAEVSPNVFDYHRFYRPTTKTSDQPPQIIFLGRLVERKGVKQLLEAFVKVHSEHPETRLIIAGDGPLKNQLQLFAKKNGLETAVNFLGFIDEAKKADLLAEADVACFPSLSGESFGISLIEAMAASRGVVLGGDNPGYRTVLGDQPLCLIDPLDASAFAQRISQLLYNKALAAKIHDWQQTEVKRYDVEVVGPQLVGCFRSQIAKRRSNS